MKVKKLIGVASAVLLSGASIGIHAQDSGNRFVDSEHPCAKEDSFECSEIAIGIIEGRLAKILTISVVGDSVPLKITDGKTCEALDYHPWSGCMSKEYYEIGDPIPEPPLNTKVCKCGEKFNNKDICIDEVCADFASPMQCARVDLSRFCPGEAIEKMSSIDVLNKKIADDSMVQEAKVRLLKRVEAVLNQ